LLLRPAGESLTGLKAVAATPLQQGETKMNIQTICGLSIGDTIDSPLPFTGTAEIIGFRYYTSRNNGRTSMVADYITHDLKASFDAVEKLIPLKIKT
jgi:hypothetical protein